MAFINKTKANYSFKVIQGKAHTANDRELSNESISSGILLSSERIFADSINSNPTDPSNSGVVSDQVTLIIKPIVGSDGENLGVWAGYRCYIGGSVPASLSGVINPLTGSPYAINDPVGNIIPQSFGDDFRPILYEDSALTTEIPPSDASDWFLDPYAGIITQEADDPSNMFKTSTGLNGTHNGRLECYIYIGDYVIDKLDGLSTSSLLSSSEWLDSVITSTSSIPLSPSNGDRYLLDSNASGSTFSEYEPISGSSSIYTSSGWEVIEYDSTNSAWIVTEPSLGMNVVLDDDIVSTYRYYSGQYNRLIQESTYPTRANKNMSANSTSSDGDLATNTPITFTPTGGSFVEVNINGVQVSLEDSATQGSLVSAACYFSNNGTASHSIRVVRRIDEIQTGDSLYWVGSNAQYELDAQDIISLNYVQETPGS